MKFHLRRFLILSMTLAAVSTAAAPIRVGILKGTGVSSRYWHTSIHTAAAAITAMLEDPAGANLGPSLLLPPQEFHVDMYGPDASTCSSSGCGPTASQVTDFINALDSLDVVIVPNLVDIGSRITTTAHRQRFKDFWLRKGLVSLHQSTDSYGTWAAWDSAHGTRFQNHPSSDRNGAIRLDSLGAQTADGAWWMLNAGLADTTFLEEWLSFTHNGDVIRAVPGIKVLVNLDETRISGGLGGMRAMGDHPISWYREFPEGGRLYYTGIGHRANLYQGGAQPRFLRRQIYNAVLWAAGYNGDGSRTVTGIKSQERVGGLPAIARTLWSGNALEVEVVRDEPHTVEIRTFEGRLVESRRGAGSGVHRFDRLPSGSTLVVMVKTPAGRVTKLVAAP